MAKRGRSSPYKPEFVEKALKHCRAGATLRELAQIFGVHVDTICEWKLKYPEFSEAIKVGKSTADDRVEHALYNRAAGYSFDSEKIFVSKTGKVTRVKTVEHIAPDTTAQIFWLKNRRPDKWRDRQQHEVSGPDGGAIKTEVDLASGLAFTLKKGLKIS